jgi:hypothetical protein
MDPTPQLKYLQWMVMQFENDVDVDETDMETTIRKFHSVQQRLPSDKRDINQYKSLETVKTVLSQLGDVSKTQQKQTAKAEGSQHIGIVEGYDVYFITSHAAAQLLGKGTKWCITTNSPKDWEKYTKSAKFFFAIRKQAKNNANDKLAFVCYKKRIDIFDSTDKLIDISKVNTKLYEFISNIENTFIDYVITSKNHEYQFKNGKLSFIKGKNGTKIWYRNGKRHREDGPAFEGADGTKKWYINDKLHREDGPAVITSDGSKEWRINGELHREDGPAREDADGTKWWLQGGKLHREDGPAFEDMDGTKEWYVNGERIKPPQ